MNRLLAAAIFSSAAPLVAAHDGHGIDFAHWHATDVWGFMALGVVAALVVWMRRGQ
jgi:hypothetical protein